MPSPSPSSSFVFLTCTILLLLLASTTTISAVPLSPSAAVLPQPAIINDSWTLSHFYNDASSITTAGYTGVEKCMRTLSLEPYTVICSSNEKKWLKVTVSVSPDFVVTSTSSASGKCAHPFLHEDFGILGCFEGDRIYFYNLSTFEAISDTPSKLLTTVTSNSYYTLTGRYFVASDGSRFIYKCDLMNLTSECVESDLVAALTVRPLDVVGSKDGTKLFVTTIEDSTNSQFLDYFNMSAEDPTANLTNVDYEFIGADTTVFHELFMRYEDDTDTHFIYTFAKTFMVVTTQRGTPNSTHPLSMTSSTARSSFFPTALGGFFFPSPAPSSSTKSTDYLIVVGQNNTKYGSPYDSNLVVSVINLTSNVVTQAPPVGGCDPSVGEFRSVVMVGSNATDLFFQVFLSTGTDQCVFRMEAPSMTSAPPTSSPSPSSIPPPPPPTTTPTPDEGNNRNRNPSSEDDSSKKVAVIASTSVIGGLVVLGAIGGVVYYSVYYVKYRSVSVENNTTSNNNNNQHQHQQHDNNTTPTEMQHQQEPASTGNNNNNNGFNNSTFSISNGTPSAV